MPRLAGIAIAIIMAGTPPLHAHEGERARIAALTQQIARDANNASLYLKRGSFHHLDGHHTAALKDFDKATSIDHELPGLRLARARALAALGRVDYATNILIELCVTQPHNAAAWLERARLHRERNQTTEAAVCYERALAHLQTPRPDHFLDYAEILASGESNDNTTIHDAIAVLDRGLRELGMVIALQLRAIEYERCIGRHEAALARVAEIMNAAKRDERWHFLRGEILEELNDQNGASAAYAACLREIAKLPPRHRTAPAMQKLKTKATAELALRAEEQSLPHKDPS